MTPYVKGKVRELVEFMKKLSQRQRDIQKEMSRVANRGYKDILNNERTTNTAVLRIASWIKMTLEGKSLDEKMSTDGDFIQWMYNIKGFYIWDYLAGLWGLSESVYKTSSPWSLNSWHRMYFRQAALYYYIYDMLFPEKMPGLFGIQCDDDVECDTWRTYFKELINIEWRKFKEMRGY